MPEEFSFATPQDKKHYVERMFSRIARRYDFFNHFLSAGFDRAWRRKAIRLLQDRMLSPEQPHILDVACGTGDLAFEALRQMPNAEITAIDLAEPMLDLLRSKASARNLMLIVERGDVEALEFADQTFDGVTIGFGTRNFTSLPIAFREIHRVLKPGGVFVNLELARPRVFPMKQLYRFYFDWLLPRLAKLFAGDESAYRYLPDSLRKFPDLEPLAKLIEDAGFRDVQFQTLTAGIVAIHSGIRAA
ncbi:MAG: bifunctional demethylmenaquinone methyltransferase/2-methoxy-6-polyprenyl-1,4-benzoquinol methylase UbiE [Bacteroidota bacterium]|nr:bifunctional demethylmenaquinone methyltransferase/2-methoxy-6-polyprenyl-1,4-benzoquinol methylase UbiE [Bacteroidota bacterium]MDP4233090.1 bifunctional demethylmenaquinone methyltransferase/2-methoxy-6-polyprenyl-1,4-benzoquinol methylase UbiE [Bacteroidota bacterium]MDP4241765.1 bifunctional demethylmenaquinone methyltransferase/2-methoxy-6-polyprenyl-1,4-benzoquinol methylase UbiE [Bacteroidota bacterium]MDP4287423.1 bifunctional demethylmenaquinone methyltransferase/2-methoxy-6-polypren